MLPYSALVLSVQNTPMTSKTWLSMLSDTVAGVEELVVLVEFVMVVKKQSLSFMRQ